VDFHRREADVPAVNFVGTPCGLKAMGTFSGDWKTRSQRESEGVKRQISAARARSRGSASQSIWGGGYRFLPRRVESVAANTQWAERSVPT
jgi:hypothetical protein